MSAEYKLEIVSGGLAGRVVPVPTAGLRLGRSSTCEISVPGDPALSRNHCIFELRGGVLYIADLNSANGTEVNGKPVQETVLKDGDRVCAGGTELVVRVSGAAVPAPSAAAPECVDLGFGRNGSAAAPSGAARPQRLGALLATAGGVAVLAGVALYILCAPQGGAPEGSAISEIEGAPASVQAAARFVAFYEKTVCSPAGILRYALSIADDGAISVEIDEVPDANRHLSRTEKPGDETLLGFKNAFADPALAGLRDVYQGPARPDGAVSSRRLCWTLDGVSHDVYVENCDPPPAVETACRELETLANNAFGIWMLQYSSGELVAMAAEAQRNGDVKWEDRNVEHGNTAAAVKHYREAIELLKSVDRKPAGYANLVESHDRAVRELDARWRALKGSADVAINTRDFAKAAEILREILRTVTDETDERRKEAERMLFDAERRLSGKDRK